MTTNQLTQEQAIAMFNSGAWKTMTAREIAEFQLVQDLLCVPFSVFHESIEKALGRPVFTHEFGLNRDGLLRELRGDAPAPTMTDVLNLIPAEKRVLIVGRKAQR